MLKNVQLSILLLLALPFFGFGQHNTDVDIPYRLRTIPWAIGGGINLVNYESDFDGVYNGKHDYTILPIPSRGNLIYDFKRYLNIEGVTSLNRYRYTTNKYTYVNDTLRATATNRTSLLFMMDLHGQFSIPSLNAKMQNYFKPYLVVGPGITFRQGFPVKTTTNVGIGFYSWITYNWGLQVQSLVKLSNSKPFLDNGYNYVQHSFSIVYHLGGNPRDNNDFSKSKHPAAKKKYKFKPEKNGN
ncbi:MAG: hypothetical protein PHQ74_06805 [Crocinitomicaceae bacterium]|nr:hypothetical protein [Crocinitomicaceae bacterium]